MPRRLALLAVAVALVPLAVAAAPPPAPAAVVAASPAVATPAPPAPRWRGERIRLSLRDADLVEVLRSFARLGDFDLVIDPRVRGTVTVELVDVPWDQALSVILRTHGLAAEIDGTIVGIGPLPGLAPR